MTKSPAIYRRISKPSSDFLRHKNALFSNNEVRNEEQKKFEEIYKRCGARTKCKICDASLEGEADLFYYGDIGFCKCLNCGHLNGFLDDGPAFHQAMYFEDGGENYGRTYTAEDKQSWTSRRDDIYLPKVDFLFESLTRLDIEPGTLSYADLGAGSGYLVGALLHRGIEKASGYDVSSAQVAFGNEMIGRAALQAVNQAGIYLEASRIQSDVVSLIGVLEHLQSPNELLQALGSNRSARFVYMSLPMVSFSVIVEGAFPKIARRHLTGGHTHLFTERSLRQIETKYNWKRISEWRFGSDISDLFRSLLLTFQSDPRRQGLAKLTEREFLPLIDRFQNVLDDAEFCSEIHALWQIK